LAPFGATQLGATHFGATPLGATPFVVVSPVSESEPFGAVSPVSESEPFVAVSPVSESEPRPAPVKSAITSVVPVDKFFRLLVVETPAPASMIGERHAGQRQICNQRQGHSQQRKTPCFQFEHRILLIFI